MTQRDEIVALREEIAELRKELFAVTVAVVRMAANQPVQYVPYYVPPVAPVQPWQPPYQPSVTYTSPNVCDALAPGVTVIETNGSAI